MRFGWRLGTPLRNARYQGEVGPKSIQNVSKRDPNRIQNASKTYPKCRRGEEGDGFFWYFFGICLGMVWIRFGSILDRFWINSPMVSSLCSSAGDTGSQMQDRGCKKPRARQAASRAPSRAFSPPRLLIQALSLHRWRHCVRHLRMLRKIWHGKRRRARHRARFRRGCVASSISSSELCSDNRPRTA